MKKKIKTVTIYAASSSQVAPIYFEVAEELGKLIAESGLTCINGAGNKGLMAAVSDAVLQHGGKVCGIIPEFMLDEGWGHEGLSETIVTSSMHERKEQMAQKSDACIALPGGIGTLEEMLEIMTWKQLGLYAKPIVVLNVNHYFDDLFAMLKKAEQENFMHHKHQGIWQVATTPQEAIEIVFQQTEWEKCPRSFAAM